MRILLLTLAMTLCFGLTGLAADVASPPTAEVAFDTPPAPATAISPKYPEAARKEGITGMVLVKISIAADGSVTRTEIAQSVRKDLDQAAVEALTTARWTPAQKDGKPVACEVTVPIQFKLAEKGEKK
ncbi:energy transducer TonB [bacterium]|nr:energy transducer TonB [bacterium]MBU1984710.1 energy transducer TonB [bacterium]